MELFFEICTALQKVSVLPPAVGHIARIRTRQMTCNDVTHAENSLTPTRGVHQVLFRVVHEDIFELESAILTHHQILLSSAAMVCRGTTFGIRQILEAKIFFPLVLDDLHDPGGVDKLIGVKLTVTVSHQQ